MSLILWLLCGTMVLLSVAFLIIAIREKRRYRQKPRLASVLGEIPVTPEFLRVLNEIGDAAERRLRAAGRPSRVDFRRRRVLVA